MEPSRDNQAILQIENKELTESSLNQRFKYLKQIQNMMQSIKSIEASKIIIALLFAMLLLIYVASSQNSLAQKKYLTVTNSKGGSVELSYLNNQQIAPKNRRQAPLFQLKLKNTTIIRLFLAQYENKFQFSKKLFMNWKQNSQIVDEAQYYLLNLTYNLDKNIPQRRMCVMAPFQNLLKYGYNGTFHNFLKSIDAQNYSNYMVYMIDDLSSDQSVDAILAQLENYPRLSNRLRILKNAQKMGALGNRDSTTRNYCRSGDIVMDIDGDDALIGKQVFNLYNHIYENNTEAWFVYSNFLAVKGSFKGDGRGMSEDMSKATKGPCKKIPEALHNFNTYRTNIHNWVTSQLRSYLRDLYVKIPLEYVLQRKTGRYYFEASDRFTMYALAELAGPNHTFFYEQYTYFYYEPNFQALQKLGCKGGLPVLFYSQAQSRMLTPLMPLKSLESEAEVTPFYVLPKNIVKYYLEKQFDWLLCQEEMNEVSDVFKY